MIRVNNLYRWLAEKITRAVGTMWCAYAFAALAVCGFPGLLGPNALQSMLWCSTIFLQFVLLSVLAKGQTLMSDKHDDHHAELVDHLTKAAARPEPTKRCSR